MNDKRSILAFAHIPKTAGTTLLHILRYNYFMRCIDVQPLSKRSSGIFSSGDMRKILLINPFIQCIVGHSVRPYSDLKEVYCNIKYITILRDPINRCISHYQQRVKKFGEISLKEFLSREWVPNLQTRFIAGSLDLYAAKKILSENFFVIGILEELDEFLILLSKKLKFDIKDMSYTVKRVTKDKNKKNALRREYKDFIIESHQLDIELYDYTRKVILPKQKSMYGQSFEEDVASFRNRNTVINRKPSRPYIDYLIRKLYYRPIIQTIRKLNGLPAGIS